MDYTAKAKTALGLAASAARSMGQNYIGTEHILLGLIRQQTGMAAQALLVNGVDETKLVDLIMELIAPTGHLELKEREGYSPRAQQVIGLAFQIAEQISCFRCRNRAYSDGIDPGRKQCGSPYFKYYGSFPAEALYRSACFHGERWQSV